MYVAKVRIIALPPQLVTVSILKELTTNVEIHHHYNHLSKIPLTESYYFASFFPIRRGDIALLPGRDGTIIYGLITWGKSYQYNNLQENIPMEQIVSTIHAEYFLSRQRFFEWRKEQLQRRGIEHLPIDFLNEIPSSAEVSVSPEMLVTDILVENILKSIIKKISRVSYKSDVIFYDMNIANSYITYYYGNKMDENFCKEVINILIQRVFEKLTDKGFNVTIQGTQLKINLD